MTSNELEEEVWKLIDDNCMSMGKQEYLDFLRGISSDADTRAEAVEQELEEED